jgi:hypothetical protein
MRNKRIDRRQLIKEERSIKKRTTQPGHDRSKRPGTKLPDSAPDISIGDHTSMLARAQSVEARQALMTRLQQTHGNAYVQRLVDSLAVQTKLTVSQPGDMYEQEADRVAETVTKTPAVQKAASPEEEEELVQGKLQRQEVPEEEVQTKLQRQEVPEEEEVQTKLQRQEEPEEEEVQTKLQRQEVPEEEELVQGKLQRQEEPEEEEEPIQTKADADVPEVTENMEKQIDAQRGAGQALDESARIPLESGFGHDFSQVRVHTGAEANRLSRTLGAEAFTTGRDVFFRDGAYHPQSDEGKKLIAHELTHVVQQGSEATVSPFRLQRAEMTSTENQPKASDTIFYVKSVQEDIEKFYQEGNKIIETGSKEAEQTYQWEGNTMMDKMGYKLETNGNREEFQHITWIRPDGSRYEDIHIVSYDKAQNKTTINHDVVLNGASIDVIVKQHDGLPEFLDWTVPPPKS